MWGLLHRCGGRNGSVLLPEYLFGIAVKDELLLLRRKVRVLSNGVHQIHVSESAEVGGSVGAKEQTLGAHGFHGAGDELPCHREGGLVRADIVLQGRKVKPDIGQGKALQPLFHGVQFGLLGSKEVADHEPETGMPKDQAAQRFDLAAGAAQLADVYDKHQPVILGKGGFPLHHLPVQSKYRMVCH